MTYEEIGARLRRAREARGLTQQEMADRLAMSQVGYRNWETGERKLPILMVPRIAEVLDMSRLTLLRLLGLADEEETESVEEWLRRAFYSSRQKAVRPGPERMVQGHPLPGRVAAHQDESTDYPGLIARVPALAGKSGW